MSQLERRAVLELRRTDRRLEGYAARFDTRANIGDFTESISRGAFRSSLQAGQDILALVDHNPTRVLARTRSGTLKLSEDSAGLEFSLNLPDTTIGRDVLALAERNDLGGMSFGFIVPKGGDSWSGNHRILNNVDLREISVVSSFPAYDGTSVVPRSKTPSLNLARRFMETCGIWRPE
jgi:HK97 family phage prohead protease